MRTALFSFCLVLLCAAQALGGPLRVVTEEWPPYNYLENGRPAGLVTDIVRAALDRSGLDYSIEVLPWARAYELARHEADVMLYSVFKLPGREALFRWVRLDGLCVQMYLFRPKFRRDIRLKTLDDAKAYRVGLTRDSAPHQFLRAQGFVDGVNLFPVSNALLNVRKSRNNRIDLITGDPLSQAYRLRQAGLPTDYCVRLLPIFSRDLYVAFSLGTPGETVDRVRTALREVREAGVCDALLAAYRGRFGAP